MRFLWSLLVGLAIVILTVLAGTFVTLASFLLWPIDRNRRVGQLGATAWGWLCFRVNPLWSLEVRGRENMTRAGAAVLCANHTSQVDIFAFSGLHGQWRWVAKTEVFWIPFLGWAMKAIDSPFVRRGDKESGKKLLEHCRRHLGRGVSILIFPEGTRSEDGNLQGFKAGAFKLALETGRPVVPLVIVGANEALPKGSWDLSRRAHVVVSALEAIDPAPWQPNFDLDGLSEHVHARMADEIEKIRSERRQLASAL